MSSDLSDSASQGSVFLADLPGAELVLPGLRDLATGLRSIAACLVSIARPELERHGLLDAHPRLTFIIEPERELYRLLQQQNGDPYGRYNSLLRRLVSFERALRRLKSKG